jgi:hypothetical protein
MLARSWWNVDNITAAKLSREIRDDGEPQDVLPVDIISGSAIMADVVKSLSALKRLVRMWGVT